MTDDTPFIAFRRFNDPELKKLTGLRARIGMRANTLFVSDSLPDRIVRALAARRALPIKEIFESFEFFERVRRRVRAPVVADLCCGQGLTGLLFAVFSRQVEQVLLVDQRRPKSHAMVYEAIVEVAPWVAGRVRFIEKPLKEAAPQLPKGASVVAVHACGGRTDACLDIAVGLGGRLAVMPCCYFNTARRAPKAVVDALGPDLASDIDRSYRLEAAGYLVEWSAIPEAVTPKRRILVGTPPKGA